MFCHNYPRGSNVIAGLLHICKVMELTILAFGIAKDIFGATSITIGLENEADTGELKTILESRYPKLKQLASYMVAVNNEYAGDELALSERDEIAIIPPVSGG